MKHTLLFSAIFYLTLNNTLVLSQNTETSIESSKSDSIVIREIYNRALSDGKAYENLRYLCKEIGARVTGSSEAQMAIEWGQKKLADYDINVSLQEITVPHWERGTKEAFWIRSENGEITKINGLALGGSIGTNGILRGELIVFNTLEDLKETPADKIDGKIIFINQHMNEKHIQTFKAYGGCYPVRGNGASEGAKKGALAVIIRSLGLAIDDHPHTGSMRYEDGVKQIPAAAISTSDAERIENLILNNPEVKYEFVLEMDCKKLEDKISYNVIGEIPGNSKQDEIITIGGHLDSWDTGEGAHDDGAGIIHCLEAFRILRSMNYIPKHTLRVVFFMNEENGNMGGKTYAQWVKEKKEKHIAALESDRGGFAPRGFTCDGSDANLEWLKAQAQLFEDYDLHVFDKGYGGVDIGPLKKEYPEIALFGFVPDSQRYFDMHHSPNDVFENVNKRELELGAAAIASFLYLLDQQFK
ncbi:M20/M25/M40 family metallo-hydrolase [Crocinitomicaceae bacterium]|nr:M20/M25/M40 family metallo-hydrolase [Crocinitomicaceae bacterium]